MHCPAFDSIVRLCATLVYVCARLSYMYVSTYTFVCETLVYVYALPLLLLQTT